MSSSLINAEVADSIRDSVLCWLATVSEDGVPNVSPKEAFLHDGEGRILVANIASPVTVRNIRHRPDVCLSFVDVFVQKGFKIQGTARLVGEGDEGFALQKAMLTAMIGERFTILSIIEITPVRVDVVMAPSYRFFPETDELDRIRDSMGSYRVEEFRRRVEQG